MTRSSLGLIETKGLVGSIVAADAAAKAAAVVITNAELTPAAFMTLRIEGELSAVKAAVDAGARAAEIVGELVAAHVIPRPDDDLGAILPRQRYISKYHPDDKRPPIEPYAPSAPLKRRAPAESAPGLEKKERSERAPDGAPRVTSEPPKQVKPPRPKPRVTAVDKPAPMPPATEPTMAELEQMPVVKLRSYARTISGLPIQGRQISMANKEQLLEVIRSHRSQG